MPVTNIKISMNEYKRLINEDAEKAVNNPVYHSLLENLSALTNLTQQYFSYDSKGNLSPLSADDYAKLTDSYTKLAKSCNDFLSADHKKNRLEKKRLNMIKQLQNCVGKDLQGLINADKTKTATLSDVVKDARTRKVDLTGKELGNVGGNLNSRIPLKIASGTKGYFTKKVSHDLQGAIDSVLAKYGDSLPQQLKDAITHIKEKKDLFNYFNIYKSRVAETNKNRMEPLDAAIRAFKMLESSIDINEIKKMAADDPVLAEKIVNTIEELVEPSMHYEINKNSGIKDGSRMDQRNAAMTDVASLMGMGKMLVKSTPMTIVHGGETIEGTFMETAEGEDIRKMSLESTLMQADKSSFNNPALLKQIADIQILDYICGNTDRHEGNMLYHTDVDENGKTVITGLTGIDNDMSFGTRLFNDKVSSSQLTKLQEIEVISQSCYDTVMNMSGDVLKVVLADKLTLEETEAVVKRLTNLQEELKKGKIKIVEDKQWGKDDLTLDNLRKKGVTFFNINQFAQKIEYTKNNIIRDNKHKVDTVYAAGKEITDLAPDKFSDIYNKIVEFGTKTNSLKGSLHRDSEEYKDMLEALKDVKEYGRTIGEKLANGENVSMDEYTTFAQKTAQLGMASQDYMDAKSLSQRTEFGQNRFAFAKEMRNLAQENFPVKELPEEPEAEKQPSEERKI